MTFHPVREELAWAAGFFDGEGNVRAKGVGGKSRYGTLTVVQAEEVEGCRPAVLLRFDRATASRGKWYRYAPGKAHHKAKWHLEFHSFEIVQATVALMWEWMSPVKREQARQTLTTLSKPGPRFGWCFKGHRLTGKNRGANGACLKCRRIKARKERTRDADLSLPLF